MSGETKKKGSNKDSIRIILVIALIIIAAGSGYKIYTDSIAQDELQAEFDQTKATITTKLDSISGQLSSRISEIARLGGNIDSLVTLKDSIIAQRDQLQRTRTANKAIINRLDRKVTGYEELLLAKDDEIEALKVINSKLLVENTELKVEKNELNATIREANQTQQKLEQKVSLAAKLNAENIKVFNVNSRGKEREGHLQSVRKCSGSNSWTQDYDPNCRSRWKCCFRYCKRIRLLSSGWSRAVLHFNTRNPIR
jgi:chromosome segregation ATPase